MRIFKKKRNKKFFSNFSSDSKAALFTLGFVYLFLITETVYKVKRNRDICTWELMLIFLMFAVFGIFKKFFTSTSRPNGFDGQPLPIGTTKEEKDARNKYYLFSSLLYALVFAIVVFIAFSVSANVVNVNIAIELFADTEKSNILTSLLISVIFFVISFSLAYIINYVWYEHCITYLRETEIPAPDIKEDFEKIKLRQSDDIKNEQKPSPKKRGRPKKQVEEVQETVQEATPKKRGRPKKEPVTVESEK